MSALPKTDKVVIRVNEEKWSKHLMKAGWTVVPNVIFEYQQALGLDALDINILLHIASYWWRPEGKPHPSKVTIARSIGVEPRTVQRHIAAMEAAGFIRREERRIPGVGSDTNVYHLDGLIKAAAPYAADKVDKIEKKKKARAERAVQKGKTKFRVVGPDNDDA